LKYQKSKIQARMNTKVAIKSCYKIHGCKIDFYPIKEDITINALGLVNEDFNYVEVNVLKWINGSHAENKIYKVDPKLCCVLSESDWDSLSDIQLI
jgi:hypothetical protein